MTSEEQNARGRWLRTCAFYSIHAVIAGIAVFLVSMFIGAGIEALNHGAGNLLFWAPVFPGQIILGFFAGFAVNKYLQSRSATWVWILPALWLLSDFPSSIRNTGWIYTLGYLFGGKCSDCVEVVFLVAPFYGSIAYSLGAWVALKRKVLPSVHEDERTLLKFLLVALYSLAVVIGVFTFTFSFVLLMMLVSRSSGGLATTVFGRPYYAGQILVALVGGVLIGRRVKPIWATWVWVLPSIWLLFYMVYSARSSSETSTMQYVWTHFFTGRCAAINMACPQETFGTCPFFSSLAYSLGAWITSRIGTSRLDLESKPTPTS